jgi:glucose-6-phosphate isomerase, archaeal
VSFDPGFDIQVCGDPIAFFYGPGVFGPVPEFRRLDAIRPSLLDPDCNGPDPVYGIVMDVGKVCHRAELQRRALLFGVVAYAAGRLGEEPVRSQGHVHKISSSSGWPAPEIFEVWQGKAIVYLQESDSRDPGRCCAIEAQPGERVVAPPGWAHAVISADPLQPLVFGAWCDRDYGFMYEGVRRHRGLAWFPRLGPGDRIEWVRNENYRERPLVRRRTRSYPELGLADKLSMYTLLERKPDSIQWVSRPSERAEVWKEFEP